MRARIAVTLAMAARAGACAALLFAVGGSHAGPAPRTERLYAACVEAMVKATCTAMGASTDAPAASPNETVFVVGVGRIDAASYRKIQAYGERMCGEARDACVSRPDGADCRTAQALWGAAGR